MSAVLSGRRVAILAADGVERVELEEPRRALEGAGADIEVVSVKRGEIAARDQDLVDAGTFDVDVLVGDASVDDYDALLLPGGTVNPDKLRTEPAAVRFVGSFVRSGKPVASICHGPWTLLEADVVRGRRLTSWPSLRTDLRNAGADVVDEQVVTDGNLTTSRSPDDLPAFCERIVAEFADAEPAGRGADHGAADAQDLLGSARHVSAPRPAGRGAQPAGARHSGSGWASVTVLCAAEDLDEVAPPAPLAELGDRVEVRVRVAPGDKGTELSARLRDRPAGATRTTAPHRLVGDDPEAELRSALRRAKQLLEVGEVLAVDPAPHGERPATPAGGLLESWTRSAAGGGVR